jgi:hypothetical protein
MTAPIITHSVLLDTNQATRAVIAPPRANPRLTHLIIDLLRKIIYRRIGESQY